MAEMKLSPLVCAVILFSFLVALSIVLVVATGG
jgi:hypothetical protein